MNHLAAHTHGRPGDSRAAGGPGLASAPRAQAGPDPPGLSGGTARAVEVLQLSAAAFLAVRG